MSELLRDVLDLSWWRENAVALTALLVASLGLLIGYRVLKLTVQRMPDLLYLRFIQAITHADAGSRYRKEELEGAVVPQQQPKVKPQIKGLGERPLVFITHSMGGIVVKQFLRHAESVGVMRWESISKKTKGIAFIATPHSGAHIANFAKRARAVYRTNEHVRELGAHESRLRELHGWFLKYQGERNVICRTYCERREVRPEIPCLHVKLPKGVLVVDETSAEPNIRGERAVPLDEDHFSICRPANREAQLYKSITKFLVECLRVICAGGTVI